MKITLLNFVNLLSMKKNENMMQEYILCYQNYNRVVLFPNRCRICQELCYPVFPNDLLSVYRDDIYRCSSVNIDVDNFLKLNFKRGMKI